MTEVEWLACTDLQKMLDFLRGKVSDRRCWLFVAAFWRIGSQFFSKKMCRRFAKIVEGVADGSVPPAGYRATFEAVQGELVSLIIDQNFYRAAHLRDFREILFAGVQNDWKPIGLEVALLKASQHGFRAAQWITSLGSLIVADKVRDIIGNPFRPTTLDPAILTWNDATVVHLAQAAYDERQMPAGTLDNGRLAVLADALEEAGCTDADILSHCRSGGEHVRGCWVVDLVLGKS